MNSNHVDCRKSIVCCIKMLRDANFVRCYFSRKTHVYLNVAYDYSNIIVLSTIYYSTVIYMFDCFNFNTKKTIT